MRDKLNFIFDYYKRKYGLKTILAIKIYSNSMFHTNGGRFNSEHNKIKILIRNTDLVDNIITLLHEIGHSIDYTFNKSQMEIERNSVDGNLYNTSKEYHDNCPFEQRAIIFADRESNKWLHNRLEAVNEYTL